MDNKSAYFRRFICHFIKKWGRNLGLPSHFYHILVLRRFLSCRQTPVFDFCGDAPPSFSLFLQATGCWLDLWFKKLLQYAVIFARFWTQYLASIRSRAIFPPSYPFNHFYRLTCAFFFQRLFNLVKASLPWLV